MAKRFLTARWENIVLLNYSVPHTLLERFVPAGTELDFFEGRTYLSIVGFEFNQTRLGGWAVPFHRSFEEVNLRFYVRRCSKRGVVFLRELVPKRAVAAVARVAFNENYSFAPMSHRVEVKDDIVTAEYAWQTGEDSCSMWIETEGSGSLPGEGSEGQFIAEHYWGYARQRDGGSLEYEVQHPPWRLWTSRRANFSGNAGKLYGKEVADVLTREPDSAFFARGSEVTVFQGVRIG